jgi:hypothetical protein
MAITLGVLGGLLVYVLLRRPLLVLLLVFLWLGAQGG